MRRVLILVLLVALGISAELWVNAIRDPGAELGAGDWEAEIWENPDFPGSGDSARVDNHDTNRAYEGDYSFLTDTKKNPRIGWASCQANCHQALNVPKAIQDIDSCFWVIDLEDTYDPWLGEFYILFRSQSGRNIRWVVEGYAAMPDDTLYSLEFPTPDSGVWTEYGGDFHYSWVSGIGWPKLDTIVKVEIYSLGLGIEGGAWYGQDVSWDNIVLSSVAYYDYAAESIDSDAAANELYTPVATFANEGILDDMDGMVYAEILDGETKVYIDSQTVFIPAESSKQITFSEWTVPHDGSYTLRVYPILELDEFSDDDTLVMILTGEGIEETPVETELIRTSYDSKGVLFSFPSGTNGQLSIYDATGRQVYTENVNPGTQELLWSTLDIPSGLYFYRFRTSGWTLTDKLVVLY